MSQDLEKNKIFAAILVAGIVAMLCGFVARTITHTEEQEQIAIEIDTSALEAEAGGGAAPSGPEPILALLATADVKKGEALSKACLACHTFGNGEANKVGPNLYNIVNAKKAQVANFAYSDTLKGMGAKGESWTYQNLSHFLWKPAAYAPGTKMAFPGLKKPEDRAAVIAYLRSLSASPAALPSEAEIAAEAPKEAEEQIAESANAEAAKDEAATSATATDDTGQKEETSSSSEAVGQEKDDKEVVDESNAPDAARQAVGTEDRPETNAESSDQSHGDEHTSGKANPALTPEIAK